MPRFVSVSSSNPASVLVWIDGPECASAPSIAAVDESALFQPPMDIRIFKPTDWTTAVAEVWEGDQLIGEVSARHDGARCLYFSREAVAWGVDWQAFNRLAPE